MMSMDEEDYFNKKVSISATYSHDLSLKESFDCREIARRESNNLYAPNPYCSYDPFTGVGLE